MCEKGGQSEEDGQTSAEEEGARGGSDGIALGKTQAGRVLDHGEGSQVHGVPGAHLG